MKINPIKLLIPMKRLILFASVYGLLLLVDLFLGQYVGGSVTVSVRLWLIVMCAIVYGVYRAYMFHPESNKSYGEWLASTPWQAGKELPNGPIRIGVRDLVALAPLVALWIVELTTYASELNAEHWYVHSILPIAAFLLGYLVTISLILTICEQQLTLTVFLFVLPLMVYPLRNLLFSMAVLLLVYAVCLIELKRYFSGFPWNSSYWKRDINVSQLMNVVGWPYKELAVTKPRSSFAIPEALMISALITWWEFVWFQLDGTGLTSKSLLSWACLLATIRLISYILMHHPPISLPGRFSTLNIFIPGYDKVFVGPLCAIATAYFLPQLLAGMELTMPYRMEISLFCMLMVLLICPPSYYDWHMTGSHRIVRPLITQ